MYPHRTKKKQIRRLMTCHSW